MACITTDNWPAITIIPEDGGTWTLEQAQAAGRRVRELIDLFDDFTTLKLHVEVRFENDGCCEHCGALWTARGDAENGCCNGLRAVAHG